MWTQNIFKNYSFLHCYLSFFDMIRQFLFVERSYLSRSFFFSAHFLFFLFSFFLVFFFFFGVLFFLTISRFISPLLHNTFDLKNIVLLYIFIKEHTLWHTTIYLNASCVLRQRVYQENNKQWVTCREAGPLLSQ